MMFTAFVVACSAGRATPDKAEGEPGRPTDTGSSAIDSGDSGEPDDSASEIDDSGDESEDPCVELGAEHPCCREWEDFYTVDAALPEDVEIPGEFGRMVEWDDGEKWTFFTDDGVTYEVNITTEGEGWRIPDLHALGPVIVIENGGGDPTGEASDPGTFTILDATGELILVIGTGVDGAAAGLVADADAADETCPERPWDYCSLVIRHLPVEFTFGAERANLFHGDRATLGGVEVSLFRATYSEGCDDGDGAAVAWLALAD